MYLDRAVMDSLKQFEVALSHLPSEIQLGVVQDATDQIVSALEKIASKCE